MSDERLLEVTDLNAAVQGFQVIHDVSLSVEEAGAVGLIGRNGAGKTSTFRGIMGLTEVLSGSVTYRGEELTGLGSDQIPKRGIGYQPEDRKLFTGMTVDENLRLPIWTAGDERETSDREEEILEGIYDLFPELNARRNQLVENLSGGEAKMAAIGRALALDPDLLILDEPLEGLAPVIVENLKGHISEINDQGIAVLIAESNFSHIIDVVDELYVIERGEIFRHGPPETIQDDDEVQELMQGSGVEAG